MEKKDNKKLSVLSEGIMIALGSAASYMLAFFYEYGYASFYGIPIDFIKIGLVNVFIAAVSLSIVFFALIMLLNILLPLVPQNLGPVSRQILNFVPMYIVAISSVIIYSRHPNIWKYTVLTALSITVLTFILPLVSQRGKKTYKEKLDSQLSVDSQQPTFATLLYNAAGKLVYWSTAVIFILAFAMFSSGRATAMDKEEYLVAPTNPKTVVLRNYDGLLICAEFNSIDKTISRNFVFINTDSELNKMSFATLKVGPLVVRK